MPKVTPEYRDARRVEIIDAAVRAFRQGGFQKTSMADIISESGMSAGAIYNHYSSKADIILDVASRVIGHRVIDLDELSKEESMPPPARLIRVLMAGMIREIGSPGIMVQLWGEAISDPSIAQLVADVLATIRGAYGEYIARWHEKEHGASPEEAAAIAVEQIPVFLGAAQGYIVQKALVPDFDEEAYFATLETYLPR